MDRYRGSSPRVRGTAILQDIAFKKVRFIPACAGNRRPSPASKHSCTVHPRVCGEQITIDATVDGPGGSSPRVRGTGARKKAQALSHRFIPACAGNRISGIWPETNMSVHPRVCGEQHGSTSGPGGVAGSSPRVRGTDGNERPADWRTRFIPACAGNSLSY